MERGAWWATVYEVTKKSDMTERLDNKGSINYETVKLNETKPCPVGPPKMGGSWWRGLTECGPLE